MLWLFCLFVCAEALLNLPEGAPCVDRDNGLKGKCVSVKQCPTVTMINIPQKKPLPEICSNGDIDPIICCTDCDIKTEDPNDIVITPDGYRTKNGNSKAWNECLENIQRLDYPCKKKFNDYSKEVDSKRNCTVVESVFHAVVFHGEDAKRREFPHMALLGYGEALDSVQWLCGGSVISKRFVLTAAHCAEHTELGPVTYVAMGVLKRSDPAKFWNKYKVRRFIIHPEYKSPIKYNDIALIETEKQFTKDVLPVCLADAEIDDRAAVVIGFGALGSREKSADTLQKASVQKFSKDVCGFLYPVHRNQPDGLNENSQTCYGDSVENADTCGGDSGGPLQVERRDMTSCVSFVVAVTSYGRECGFQGGAGVYTKVLPYLPWIESIVWP